MSAAAITIAFGLEYPLALRGGVSVLIETLIRGVAGRYRVVLVSPDDPEELAARPVAALLAGHVRWEPGKISRARSRALAAELAKRGVQLAHFHFGGTYGWGIRIPGRSPFPFLVRQGIAVCSTVHLVVSIFDGYCGSEKPWWFKLALFPGGWLGKLAALRHMRVEIAVSAHDARLLRRWYWPYAGRIRQIYHSRLDAGARPAPVQPRRKIILNVGHLALRKGQHLLAEAFAQIAPRHPDWELHLAGPAQDSACVERVRALAELPELRRRILVLGSREDVLEIMEQAAIYVQPSLAEALGLALQEALRAGCACIGAQTGGIPELITHEDNGLLYPARDVAALAAALERLIGDEALRARLGARAPKSLEARGMNGPEMVARHVALYEELLAMS